MALFWHGGNKRFTSKRRANLLDCEALESRLALSVSAPPTLEVQLIPELDQFGNQIETIQIMELNGVQQSTFGIYDTGASVVTLSSNDAQIFELLDTPVPIKVPGGAVADAIGGPLVGDVSAPVNVLADGLGAVNLVADDSGFFDFEIDITNAAGVPGVQMFVGTSQSPSLPTITGTPVHNAGVAARIDMQGFELDLGALFPELPEFEGISLFLPSLSFVEPDTPLDAGGPTISQPIRVPVELFGEDNTADPGDLISYSYNPIVSGVQLESSVNDVPATVADQAFLFDTGAQLSVISTAAAQDLNLDLTSPDTTITVQGAAGTADIPGYVIDALEVPHDDDGDGVADGVLRFVDVPVYVLDIVEGIDGIWGMNLMNTAYQFQYDPHDPLGPSVTMNFDTDPFREVELPDPDETSDEGTAAIDLLSTAFPPFAGVLAGPNFPVVDAPSLDNGPLVRVGTTEVHAAGLSVELLGSVDASKLNLYDGSDAAVELPDATLVGENSGPIDGSLVWNSSTGRLDFVKTGGPLEADNYRFTLYSRDGGLADTAGRLLDGDGNGLAGGHFVHDFVVTPTFVHVDAPDFVRSAGQDVDLKGTDGIPIRLSNGAGVTEFQFTYRYDATLLDVTDAAASDTIPDDWQVTIDRSTPGEVSVTASGLTALADGRAELLVLDAQVTDTAAFGDFQVIRLSDVQINQGAITGIGDLALHLVADLGDLTGNGDYSALDASLAARLAVGLEAGLDAFPNYDPLLLADVTDDGTISALDAAYIARRAVGVDQPGIPSATDNLFANESFATRLDLAGITFAAAKANEDPLLPSDDTTAESSQSAVPPAEDYPAVAPRGSELTVDDSNTADKSDSSDQAVDELFALIGWGSEPAIGD